jgi:hypothetical protein
MSAVDDERANQKPATDLEGGFRREKVRAHMYTLHNADEILCTVQP